MKIVDLSFDIETGMPTCGTPWHQTVEIATMGTLSTVGRNTHRLVLGSHSGTHMDAPYHFIEGGKRVNQLNIHDCVGPVQIVDLRHIGMGGSVSVEQLKKVEVSHRMLFVFGWYKFWKTAAYYHGFPYFETDAIQFLLDMGMRLMAMDTPSPDCGTAISSRGDDSPNHKLLLSREVVIIEYLSNTDALLDGKKYELIALPLKVAMSDGSPARVIARESL